MQEPYNRALPLRIGAVNYLNTKPLIYGLESTESPLRLVLDLPSRLADQLADGSLDVALVPVLELFTQPDYKIVSNACIACRGPVHSVKLYFRCPPRQTKRLALDEGSRTSAVLARILLEQIGGVRPKIEKLAVGDGLSATTADAVLLIGDRAMYPQAEKFTEVWDLGDRWRRWTGLPFVFAAWTARSSVPTDDLEFVLRRARDQGVSHLHEIAAAASLAMGIERSDCLRYLRDHLHFYLGANEVAGLDRFRKLAAGSGLIPAVHERELGVHDCATW